jgi:hypothetical protein
MQINELGLKTREVGAKEVTAGAEVMKAGAYQTDANTKAAIAPSTIANNIANTDSLIDKRKADVDSREATKYESQKVFALGIKDPSQMGPKEKERYATLSPIADTLWQSSRDSGLKMTGSQAVDIAQGLSGKPVLDNKKKPVLDSSGSPLLEKTYSRALSSNTPDGMMEIRDISSKRLVAYLPMSPKDRAEFDAKSNPNPQASEPKAGIRAPTTAVDNQKYLRSKNNRGGYDYVPSPRGLTKAQYKEADTQKTK